MAIYSRRRALEIVDYFLCLRSCCLLAIDQNLTVTSLERVAVPASHTSYLYQPLRPLLPVLSVSSAAVWRCRNHNAIAHLF